MGTGPRGFNIRVKFVLSTIPEQKIRGITMWLNVVQTPPPPPDTLPRSQSSVRDLVRVVDIVVPFAPRGSLFGENSFYRASGVKWAQGTCAGFPKQRHHTGKPGKMQGRDRVGIVEGSPCS